MRRKSVGAGMPCLCPVTVPFCWQICCPTACVATSPTVEEEALFILLLSKVSLCTDKVTVEQPMVCRPSTFVVHRCRQTIPYCDNKHNVVTRKRNQRNT